MLLTFQNLLFNIYFGVVCSSCTGCNVHMHWLTGCAATCIQVQCHSAIYVRTTHALHIHTAMRKRANDEHKCNIAIGFLVVSKWMEFSLFLVSTLQCDANDSIIKNATAHGFWRRKMKQRSNRKRKKKRTL